MPAYNAPPIPTYEEAVGSSSRDEAAESLLPQTSAASSSANNGYQPPTVESVRSSMDSSFLEEFASPRSSAESLQREMIQMEVMDGTHSSSSNSLLSLSLSKRFSSISSSLRGFSLPRNPFRGFRFRFPTIPSIPFFDGMGGAALVPVYRLLAVLFALIVVYVLLATDVLSFGRGMGSEYLGPFRPDSVREFALSKVDKGKIQHWLEYVSSFDHMAGTEGDYVLAKYIQGQFSSFGLQTEMMRYDVYLNYPKDDGRKVWMDKPEWTAVLEEPLENNKKTNTPVFHGHSKSGQVHGPIIYANYGSREDFKKLKELKIDVKGAVVLMREGGTQKDRGLKVKAAEDNGAVGALLFTDPGKEEGWKWPENAIQRGSVSIIRWLAGDPLTENIPALPDAGRISDRLSRGLVNIPSLPLSPKDARPILQAIKGKGSKVPDNWTAGISQVEYWTGNDNSPVIHLRNEQVIKDKQPVWNVLAEVKGIDSLDEKIIIGNHRDAWCFGASDPNSGTAIMLELARMLGKMMELGWRPRRTILLANWDASEYNLIGPTEFVEELGKGVANNILAYVNVDAAVTGTEFTAMGSPVMQTLMNTVLGRVKDPITHSPLNSTFNPAKMPPPNSKGGHVPFQFHSGVSSIDISFSGKSYPVNSCHDTAAWMKEHIDPDFLYHEALTKVLALLILELSDTDVIPFSMPDYAHFLSTQVSELELWQKKFSGPGLDLSRLKKAIETAGKHIEKFQSRTEDWLEILPDGTYNLQNQEAVANRRSRGLRMGNFDKHLVDQAGLPDGRGWFKHLVLSPTAWGDDGGSEVFPAIRDYVEAGKWAQAQEQVEKIAKIIEKAGKKLLDEVSPVQ